jgi:hypothetical protein
MQFKRQTSSPAAVQNPSNRDKKLWGFGLKVLNFAFDRRLVALGPNGIWAHAPCQTKRRPRKDALEKTMEFSTRTRHLSALLLSVESGAFRVH